MRPQDGRLFIYALFLANQGPLRQSTAGAKPMLLRIFSAASGKASPVEGAPAPLLELAAAPGDSLSRAIWLSGLLPPLPLCGGLGRCGRCRVRFFSPAPSPLPAEAEVFSVWELEQGWRLACRRQVPDAAQLDIALPPENLAGHAEFSARPGGECPRPASAPADEKALSASPAARIPLALAVDLGTTSVYWRAVRLPEACEKSDGCSQDSLVGQSEGLQGVLPRESRNGLPVRHAPSGTAAGEHCGAPEVVGQGRFLNPQAGAGADIMSRLAVAMHEPGRAVLSRLARQSLLRVADSLERDGAGRVERLCVAANTAMTDIFLDRPVDGLCAAPYRLGHQGHEWADVPSFPPVYIPPLPAPFVGGDVSAGLAALLAADVPRPFVLADLGTNGELALVDGAGDLLLASVPLGPALEGIGPQCGQLAGPGVITDFSLAPTGLEAHFFMPEPHAASKPGPVPDVTPWPVPHGGHCPCPACQAVAGEAGRLDPAAGAVSPARGISATGYVSLLAVLLRAGLLREDGAFVPAPAMPLARRLATALEAGSGSGGARLRLPYGQWLCAADVEGLLKVKAAFALALESLLAAAGLAPQDVSALCLAGALGEHVRAHDLQTIGFISPSLAPRLRAVGNASLDGAALLAVHPRQREELARLCARATVLSLVDEKNFHQNYLRHMRFGA